MQNTLEHDLSNSGAVGDMPDDAAVVSIRNRLSLIRQAKMKLAEEEREAIREFRDRGGNKLALSMTRRLANMDCPDDRAEVIRHLENYLVALKYWG